METEDVPMTNGYSNGHVTGENGVSTPDAKKHSSSGGGHHSSSSSSSKHKHSSSSSKDKHHSSSSKDKHHSSSSKHHSSSSSSSSRHKDGSSSSSKHHSSSSKHSSSSSSGSKHSGSSSSHKSSSKDKDRDKHHSSSSSSKDKHSSSSSSSKHRDGHHSSSSSSKHKSSSKDKHRDKERHSEKSRDEVKVKEEPHSTPVKEAPAASIVFSETVKEEKHTPAYTYDSPIQEQVRNTSMKQEDSDDDTPLTSRRASAPVSMKEESDSDDDTPLTSRRVSAPKTTYKEESDSDDDTPLTSRRASAPKSVYKEESDSEDDTPLFQRATKAEKRPMRDSSDDDDDEPLISRMKKPKKEESSAKKRKSDREDSSPAKKKKKKDKGKVKEEKSSPKKKAGAKEEPEKWKWWEEERKDDGTKWKFLEHKGPVFAPAYEPLPDHVGFYYDGKRMKLQPETEEVMTFYGRMLDHDYTTMEAFNKNFMKCWRKVMTSHEREKITDLKKCRFTEINDFFKAQSEARKNKSKQEKQKIKEENAAMVEEYGFCIMDGHKEKIGNFRIEPPGLFRGRGEHPKMGMLKTRTLPEDIIINCSKDSKIPQPPKGHKWKEVRHDNQVTWLCSWTENVQGQTKYIMLNAASKLKGEKDWMKYEKARNLHRCVDKIRANYREDWKSKEMRIRQRSVALYFIDKLALRAGNEKEEGETADTVGCCSLRVEHIKLSEELNGKENVVEFDFLGKDSIRYYNSVSVEKRVFKNLQLFMNNKKPGDDLFDRLNTAIMNKHLNTLMDGLTAKVFRTYNASKTLQEQLDLLTNADDQIPAKILSYNRANRAVAILCNHQRAAPKNFDKQKENLQNKINDKLTAVKKARKDLKNAKADYKQSKSVSAKGIVDKKKKTLDRLEEQLTKLEVNLTDKEENKEIALGTSKLNYLDPRISVAWCKKWDVPIEKIYNKTQRDKFAWAIEMVDEDFTF